MMLASAQALRVLYATPELAPWVKSGGLGDVSAALPSALRAEGVDVRVLVPGYAQLIAAFPDAQTVCELADLGGAFGPARLVRVERGLPVPLYLVDSPRYYHRPGSAYQDAQGRDWDDNHLRFGLLSRVAALLSAADTPLDWRPDVLQCNDWPTALAPAYLHYGTARDAAATLMTVHNLAFQGNYDARVLAALGLPPEAYSPEGVEFYGRLSFLKAGLYFADHISTVSERYAEEIQTEEFGCGFQGLLRHRRSRLSGITNGVDTALWNPATDAMIASRYDARHLAQKAPNKLALQEELGLRVDAGVPLLGVVGRLTHQKGLDLLAACAADIVALGAQLAVLGTGEKSLEAEFARLTAAHPGVVAAVFAFDERLAHLIEAGADIFVMPSRFEPCGLNQMYSLRYGTPPVVRATGGLADTVVPVTPESLAAGVANGYTFASPDAASLLDAVGCAVTAWRDRTLWRTLQRAGMKKDFSWRHSAARYLALFRNLAAGR